MVWFGQLDIPEEVVQAHRDGELVMFVGAGASKGSPSSLPLFNELAAQIATEVGVAMGVNEAFDVYLGRVSELANVHSRVAEIIGAPESRPNATHEAIAALARTGGACRIVSTNYDHHVSAVLRETGLDVEEWSAPALPVGSDFEGLVYLHGTLGKPPSRLVVTDEDFGRAYLRDGWATRFLDEMFRSYKTLFVGYSHEDLIMTYLGRGLRADSKRWILTDDPDSDLYKRLRVTPIPFGHRAFDDQQRGLAKWASDAGMGMLDHRARLTKLLKLQPTELEPQELSYMEGALTDQVRTQVFVDVSNQALEDGNAEAWLGWVAKQPQFRALFDAGTSSSGVVQSIAYWFADQFVVREERNEAAFRVVRETNDTVHPVLWSSIALAFFRRDEPREPWASKWLLLLLLRDAPAVGGRDILEYLLSQSSYPQDHDLIVAMLNHLLAPRPTFRAAFGAEGSQVEVTFAHDSHDLDHAIAEIVTPNIDNLAPELISLAEQHLRSAHHLLSAAGAGRAGFDPLSFGRSAIERHGQDQFRDPVDPLLDLARDSLDSLLLKHPDQAAGIIDRWLASPVRLLRRLAVHGTTNRTDLTADDKLAWLIDSALLWDYHTQHETFRLIAASINLATDATVLRLTKFVLEGPKPEANDTREDAERNRLYRVYNAIAWLFQNGPERSVISQAMAEQQAAHPDFAPREHPDLHVVMSAGFEEPQPPAIDPDDVHQAIEENVADAISMLLELDERAEWPRSTWSRASAATLSATVAKYPLDGVAISSADPDDTHEFRRTILAAWRHSQASTEHIDVIVAAISGFDLARLTTDVAMLFADSPDAVKFALQDSAQARELARKLWQLLDPAGDSALLEPSNLLERAYNSAAGRLAEYWVELFVRQWRQAEEKWEGLPPDIRSDIENSVSSGEANGKQVLARAIYLSRLHLFWSADRPWAEEWLLPLLDWAYAPETALLLWPAYLVGGRWNDQLLAAGMLEQYLAASHALVSDDDDVQRALAGHLAAISIQSTLDLPAKNWLVQLTSGSDQKLRTEWLDSIAELLRDGIGDPESEWTRWLSTYLQGRANGIPLTLTEEEASAITEIIAQLNGSFADAVAMVERTPASLNHDRFLLHRLDNDLAAQHPDATARLIVHLLANTQPDQFFDRRSLKRIFDSVHRFVEPDLAIAYREAAARLGITDALDW